MNPFAEISPNYQLSTCIRLARRALRSDFAATFWASVIRKIYRTDRKKAFALYFAEQHNSAVSSMSSPQI
jgi:hypothetical protein